MSDPRLKCKELAPYVAHGVDLEPAGPDEWVGDCLACGKAGHFYVSESRGVHSCKVCGQQGNVITFMEMLAELTAKRTTKSRWAELAEDRGVPAVAFKSAGMGFDEASGRWLIPARSAGGRVHDLRAWPCGKKRQVRSTAGCETQLHGSQELAHGRAKFVWVCEGDWDWMAWRWVLRSAADESHVAVGVPGCDTFKDAWLRQFEGKHVKLLYDADEPGRLATDRAAKKLEPVAASVEALRWPSDAAEGRDVRDVVRESVDQDGQVDPEAALRTIESMLRPMKGDPAAAKKSAGRPPATMPELMDALKRYAIVNEDMEAGLRVMLAVCASNGLQSDPLWVYVVGAASHGKTLIADCLSGSEDVVMRSCIKPQNLISGFKTASDDDDPSLMAKLKNKTLIVKDWTELLALPEGQRNEVFSILRGAFDGSAERGYGNMVHRKYDDHRFSMIACVTHRIHAESQAHMGERFLKFQFKRMQARSQDEISMRAMDHVDDDGPKRAIREVAASFLTRKLSPENVPRLPDEVKLKILALAKVIGLMRTNVERGWSGDLLYRPVSETPTRLCKQLAKLGRCLAHVDGAAEVGARQFEVVKRVAIDTAYGFHLDAVDAIVGRGGKASQSEIADDVDLPASSVAKKFEDLQLLGVLRKTEEQRDNGRGRPSTVWKVAESIAKLWRDAEL